MRTYSVTFVLLGSLCTAGLACSDSGGGAGGAGGAGGSGGDTGQAMIGPDGGSVTTTDGRLTLTVPAGALGETVDVRIAPIAIDDAPASVQALPGDLTVYDLQPAGLQFASPADLEVTVPEALTRSGDAVDLRMAFLLAESEDIVEALANQTYGPSDSGATEAILTADLGHFSTAIVQFFEGATFSATVPEAAEAGAMFDVTVTVDIEGANLGTINQAVQEEASESPVVAGDMFDGTFAGSTTVQTSTNSYSCDGGGIGLYRAIVGFEVDNDLGPITVTTLAAEVACSQSFEILDDRPGDIGRAAGSPIAAFATGTGATVINIATGEVLQRVGRTDQNEFGFPTGAANVYAPDGPIQAVIATTSAGVEGAIFGAGALSRTGFEFIPSGPDFFEGGADNLQYAPGSFASIGGSAFFFVIGDTGVEELTSLNGAFSAAGTLGLRTAYVQPDGFGDGSPMLAIRQVPMTNPAVDPPELVRLTLADDAVALDAIDEGVPSVLELPLGQVRLRCLPDPGQSQNAICGIAALGGGHSLFRWVPAELPRLSIQEIAGVSGAVNFGDMSLINTPQGTRFAATNLNMPEIRIDDVETGSSAEGLTSRTVATPPGCGAAIAVEFRSERSLLVSCLDTGDGPFGMQTGRVVTLDLPPFGNEGTGGSGGNGGCVDDIGPRPTLTAQPTVTPTIVNPGGQLMIEVPVSAEARFVKITVFDGFSSVAGEDTVTTNGSETLMFTIPVSNGATVGFDLFVGIHLCVDPDCLTAVNPATVTYTRPSSTATAGDPYFASVREDGASQTGISTLSCYDLLVVEVEAP